MGKFIEFISKYRLHIIFLSTGLLQVIIGRLLGVHDGLPHINLDSCELFVFEWLSYTAIHAAIYRYFVNL